jgi:uncharacterized protein (TIGR03492 family)
MRFLFISNGYGEDYVAVNIGKELKKIDDSIEIIGMPIVGEGFIYIQNQIPILGPNKKMPSGGFISNIEILLKDIKEGLIKLHWEQWKKIKNWSKNEGYIVAIGDIVPLFLARLSQRDFFFVSIQKSVYYTLGEKEIDISRISHKEARYLAMKTYLLEYPLMKSERVLKIFPRDLLSHEILKKSGINSEYLGNPMMDNINPEGKIKIDNFKNYYKILILPGSRIPEAYNNFSTLLDGALILINSNFYEKFLFLTALAPKISLKELEKLLYSKNFEKKKDEENYILFSHKEHLLILTYAFSDCINIADIGLCMAGTATEQFVGLGKPAIAIPGKGPQYTKRFALAQKKLLGNSLFLVEKVEEIPIVFKKIYKNNDILEKVYKNGKKRMGEKGASKRIAERIYNLISS